MQVLADGALLELLHFDGAASQPSRLDVQFCAADLSAQPERMPHTAALGQALD